jgi:Methyltransferase domain
MSKNALPPEEIARWYAGKSFSADWATWHFANWVKFLRPLQMRPVRVLEIGSWEGRSALFFLNYFPASQLVCVDTFGGNIEHMRNPHFAALIPETEQRFDANVAAFTGRVEKIKGTSADVLPRLGIAGRRFNIVYVDANHRAANVYADGALAWPMVERAGIVIFMITNSTRSRTRASGPSSVSTRSSRPSKANTALCTRPIRW